MGWVGEIYSLPKKDESRLMLLLAKEDIEIKQDDEGIKLVHPNCPLPAYIDWIDESRVCIQVIGDPSLSKAYKIGCRIIESIVNTK